MTELFLFNRYIKLQQYVYQFRSLRIQSRGQKLVITKNLLQVGIVRITRYISPTNTWPILKISRTFLRHNTNLRVACMQLRNFKRIPKYLFSPMLFCPISVIDVNVVPSSCISLYFEFPNETDQFSFFRLCRKFGFNSFTPRQSSFCFLFAPSFVSGV